MAVVVNLDALIPREDLEVLTGQADVKKTDTLQIRDLENGSFFYTALRKPDFQRETGDWTAVKICDLIETFLRGDLIPAVILWQSGKNVFVIDGAHRLSALIAWVQDDYGAGARSTEFFQGLIPDDQKRAAERTRKMVEDTIGTYKEHVQAVQHPQHARPEVLDRARRLGILAIQLQWVQTGDARKAADSFFKINQAATAIDPVELRILKSRGTPIAVAARAISRGATGHKYWGHFPAARQQEIERTAKEIHSALYVPPLALPIKTLDLPVAGPVYGGQNLALIFDLVNIATGGKLADSKKKAKELEEKIEPDPDGTTTANHLLLTQKLVNRICGTDPASLGLHPALYFYSAAGSFQHSAFTGTCLFLLDLIQRGKLMGFTKVRGDFEGIFLTNKFFVTEVIHKFGSGARSAPWVKNLYEMVMDRLLVGDDEDAVLAAIAANKDFSFLIKPTNPETGKPGQAFTRKTKSAAFLNEALEQALRCPQCRGLMHRNSMTVDHKDRRQDGGTDDVNNAQMMHPFCNSTVKR